MKTIYFARHGEALDNVEDRYGGSSNDPLTERGGETARQLAEKISHLTPSPKKIYTSSFKRAAETAEIISQTLGLSVIKREDLKERDRYGILTRLTKTEAKNKYPDLVEQVQDYRQTITGAETYEHYRYRVLKALNEIFQKENQDLLIVCHGGTFRIVMWELFGKKDYKEAALNALITIEESKGKRVLKSFEGLKFT